MELAGLRKWFRQHWERLPTSQLRRHRRPAIIGIDIQDDLKGVINPLDRKNFGGGSPLRDPEFVSGLRGILDPNQADKLDRTMTQRATDSQADPSYVPGVTEGNIASLPKMELEKLDMSIESARKVTTDIKSMMDGMGGLKELMEQPQGTGGN